MKIAMNKETVKEVLGKVIYLGSEVRYEYNNDRREYTDKIQSVTVHLGCEKLDNSVDVQLEELQEPSIKKFAEIEADEFIYDPYATVSSYTTDSGTRSRGVLTERFRCRTIRQAGSIPGKQGA